MKKRDSFTNRLGFILACVGSAVGMGNLWMFPTRVSLYGGGSFLIPYFIFVVLIGATGVIGEMAFGRAARSGPVNAFGMALESRGKRKLGEALGLIPTVGALAMAIGYTVVMGWILKYAVGTFTGATLAPADVDSYAAAFGGMASAFGNNGWQIAALLLCILIMMMGIGQGIEKANKIMMPLFFLLFVGLAVYIALQPGAVAGYRYIFRVDPVALKNPMTWIYALGQAFFSLSLGMGVMMTYASYLSNEDNLISNTAIVCTLDTLVALFAGFMIIPAVFATGIAPGMGGGFGFATLAGVFMAIPGGQLIGTVFYFLLFFAAITSSTSILEGTIAFLVEEKGFERKKALLGASTVIFIIGVMYTLSQAYMNLKGIWISGDGISYPIFGDFLEYLTDRLLLPLGAFFTTVFVGWIWGTDNSVEEATSYGKFKFTLAPVYKFIVKILDPIAIGAIIIAGLVFGMSIS